MPSGSDDPVVRGGFPARLGEVLPGALDRLGPTGLWTESRIRRAWPEAVGPQVAEHAQIGRLRGRTLEVWVDNEAWATELRYLGDVVTDRLNAVLGGGTPIREIAVRRAPKRRG